ncbi:Fe-S oxidoreductase/nitrate reductase gamma subunit [Deinobacterium chartae]|uniref:Fe-S oxidoreductase/nitrate reductase gamma subunit n=1 Tax=Deinobacterium chartae TaxID=521158 RepID=A0A841HY12_9DEIO|nr:(Fe-S)-binding protein [Deinobacterium chartae]MBB6096685.1 Fe-S oxidoreductase/nitrate reductase gamma subunit [Deinobacterium chartae]
MLPLIHQILFAVFALITAGFGLYGFYRLYRKITRGRSSAEARFDHPVKRLLEAAWTSLTQERTFRKRPWISVLHAFIFYGFVYYLLVNVVDGLEGYFHFEITSDNVAGAVYNFLADILSLLVLIGVVSLAIRRFTGKGGRVFRFNDRTLLHERVRDGYIRRDSLIVSSFIFFHVGSRVVGQGFKLIEQGHVGDPFQPFAGLVAAGLGAAGIHEGNALGGYLFGYWGALGSILLFLSYFPYTKHIHIFMAPVNYTLARSENSGTLPMVKVDLEAETPELGAARLEDLSWPRVLDAYACIQCNRCQDVCPASQTGKSLSPAALEINKRMELNMLGADFESGAASPRPLLEFAITPEAVWACTTCGACMQVCPVQDEQMLDIIDIRRQQVMVEGEFPSELQSAFRGMERSGNPWGISPEKRMEWADGLRVPTIDENPEPDVLYWVGCAAAYDPGAQKVARSFVQLLDTAGVNYAVLGKRESCTGDTARRAGNEFLYQQLAEGNIATLNAVRPKLIVATCPHCMNTIGNEYPQLGGNYTVMHHTQYLEMLVGQGRLQPTLTDAGEITYHDPCYLGRHNGVYDAPRDVIRSMGLEVLELERSREGSFCCGAGGAQFWKEEEEGDERISDNRFREIQARLDRARESERTGKVVAVGCPFCKSMLNSTPAKAESDVVVKDIAEIMFERVLDRTPEPQGVTLEEILEEKPYVPNANLPESKQGAPLEDRPQPQPAPQADPAVLEDTPAPETPTERARRKWAPKAAASETPAAQPEAAPEPGRKKWAPKAAAQPEAAAAEPAPAAEPAAETGRRKWSPKAAAPAQPEAQAAETGSAGGAEEGSRRKWQPKAKAETSAEPSREKEPPKAVTESEASPAPAGLAEATGEAPRRKWQPKAAASEASAPATPPAAVTEPLSSAAAEGGRKKWQPKGKAPTAEVPTAADRAAQAPAQLEAGAGAPRKKWQPKARSEASAETPLEAPAASAQESTPAAEAAPSETGRKKWQPKKKD